VTTRAGVTKNAFRDVFPTVEECYLAAYENGLARVSRAVTEATRRGQSWLERVRSGLVALLASFDDEPSWARMLVLEAPISEVLTLDCRRQLHDVLTTLLDGHAEPLTSVDSPLLTPALTGELIVGGVFSVIRTNMLENDGSKLVELAPSLMAFIVTPYLGQKAAQAELEGRPSLATVDVARPREQSRAQQVARAVELPIRATHRTTLVLRAIAQTPYSNNREIARAAGLTDEGQTSKLLARLERQGVIENVGAGPTRGEPNAWLLTSSGRRALTLIGKNVVLPRPRGARIRGEA
jgi:AcrR family transcriptional regulator